MEEYMEESILDELYETRTRGFEAAFCMEHKGLQEEMEKQYYKLIEHIKKLIKDEKDRKELLALVEEFSDAKSDEKNFWIKEYYKFGYSDACRLKEEAKDYLTKANKN